MQSFSHKKKFFVPKLFYYYYISTFRIDYININLCLIPKFNLYVLTYLLTMMVDKIKFFPLYIFSLHPPLNEMKYIKNLRIYTSYTLVHTMNKGTQKEQKKFNNNAKKSEPFCSHLK